MSCGSPYSHALNQGSPRLGAREADRCRLHGPTAEPDIFPIHAGLPGIRRHTRDRRRDSGSTTPGQ